MRCDVCGGPGQWRVRVVTACCMLGEATCDSCEDKRTSLRIGDGVLWRGLRRGASWLWRIGPRSLFF